MAYGALTTNTAPIINGLRELLRKRKLSPELDNSVIDQGILPDQEKYTMNSGGLVSMLRPSEPPAPTYPLGIAPDNMGVSAPDNASLAAGMQQQAPAAPRTRADYYKDIAPYQTAPQFNAPVRDTGRENKDNLLGSGLAAIIASLFGKKQFAGNAFTGYAQGARQAQDANYANSYRQAEDRNQSRTAGVNAFNQNIQRQRVEAGQQYDEDQTAGYRAEGLKNTQFDNRNQLTGRLAQAPAGSRRAIVDSLTDSDLAQAGVPSRQALYSVVDSFDRSEAEQITAKTAEATRKESERKAESDSKEQARIKQQRVAAYTKRRENQVADAERIIRTPGYTPEQKAEARDRITRINRETGIGTPNMPIPADETPAQRQARENADRNFNYRVGRDEIADYRYDNKPASGGGGKASDPQVLADRTRRSAYQGPNGINSFVEKRDKANNEANQLKSLFDAGYAANGKPLYDSKGNWTPEGAVLNAKYKQHVKDANWYQGQITQRKKMLDTAPQIVAAKTGSGAITALPTVTFPGIAKGDPANLGGGGGRVSVIPRPQPNGPRPAQHRAPDGKYTTPVPKRAAAKPKTNRVSVNGRWFTSTEVD